MNRNHLFFRAVLTGIWCILAAASFCSAAGQWPIEIDPRGGSILRIPNFDMSRPGAAFTVDEPFVSEEGGPGTGYYRFTKNTTSANTLRLLPNRNYIISVLLNAEFERSEGGRTREVNIGLRTYDGGGKNVIDNLNGLPNRTNGWQRWEWQFTTDQRATHGRLHCNLYGLTENDKLCIADIAIVELAPKPLHLYGRGEGVTFRGGPGNLPMKVEQAGVTDDKIEVRTTGALYTFDLQNDTITARQLIGRERDVSVWTSSLSLKDTKILTHTDTECVLVNSGMTIGVQCDSLMMIVPHDELILSCTSGIGGKWNRLACGHLFARDEYGGFAVNPDIPLGSGRLARIDSWVRPGRVVKGELDFSGRVDDQTFISQAQPGWKISWYVSPGERLGISVFPPRPFPWKQSFELTFAISMRNTTPQEYTKWAEHANAIIMWNFIERGWGGSQGCKFSIRDEDEFRAHIAAIKQAGMRPCPYISPYFYYSRDPAEFAAEAKRLKDKYGIEGAYYDGIPSQEWIATYEEMRMTREIFADGVIIYHNTGHASNGTAPLGEPSLKIPAIETYADITYTGELVYGYGPDWPYPKYIASQYGLSNCVGSMKTSKWDGVAPEQRDILMLKYNGRASMLPQGHEGTPSSERLKELESYWPVFYELKKLWQEKGNEPEFYERYYLPTFEKLTADMLKEYPVKGIDNTRETVD